MKLVIGGYAQGKLNYVLQQENGREYRVWDGVLPDMSDTEKCGETVIFNHFHIWVRERILQGAAPEQEVKALLSRYPDCIIISDEISNGIVPMDALEREYRERTGRLLVELAGAAEEVVRVLCGIGQKIK